MTPREICIDLPHIRLAGQRWGEGEHIVLALHGWLDNAASFAPLAPYLIDDNTSLIALEFAGHGRSAHRPLGAGYHFTDHMRDAMFAADTVDQQQVVFDVAITKALPIAAKWVIFVFGGQGQPVLQAVHDFNVFGRDE